MNSKLSSDQPSLKQFYLLNISSSETEMLPACYSDI